jgi:membrane protein YdbS with pleckstrin-like domain
MTAPEDAPQPQTAAEAPAARHVFRPAWRYQWATIASALLLFAAGAALYAAGQLYSFAKLAQYGVIAVAALGAYLIVLVVFQRYLWHYSLDSEHIESSYGLIARRVRAIRVRDLRNINVRQSAAQRLLGVGDVEFSSAAGDAVEVAFFGVPDPMGLKDYVQALQRGGDEGSHEQ